MPLELAGGLTATEADRLLQAEALVRSYCGWHIAPSRTAVELTLRPSYGTVVLLPSLMVTDVTSVVEDGTALAVDDDFTWDENGVLTRLGTWAADPIVITFDHGYNTPPADVTAIVQSVAQRGLDNPSSLVRVQKGPFADTYSQTGFNQSLPIALLDAEKEILDRYKLPPRP